MKRLAIALWLWLAFAATPAHAQPAPDALVQGIIDALAVSIKAEQQGLLSERAIVVAQGIVNRDVAPHMDFDRIAREASGKSWESASPTQRDALVREFRQLLVHVLARLLVTNQEDQLQVEPRKFDPSTIEAVIRVAVTRNRATGVAPREPMLVTLRRNGAVWKIYELRTDGVDVVRLYGANFAIVIAREGGMDGLIKVLADRNARNAIAAESRPRQASVPVLAPINEVCGSCNP